MDLFKSVDAFLKLDVVWWKFGLESIKLPICQAKGVHGGMPKEEFTLSST